LDQGSGSNGTAKNTMNSLRTIKKLTIGHILKYLISIFGEKRKCLILKSNVDVKYFRTTMSDLVSR